MERASVLLARQLPAVHKIRGTENPVHRDLVAARFMEHWLSFHEEVLHATMILGAGEYKSWWTVDLHSFPITGHSDQRGYLEPFVGKLSRPPKTLFCLSF